MSRVAAAHPHFDAYLPTCSGAAGTVLDRAMLDFEGRRFLATTMRDTSRSPVRVYAGTQHGDAATRAASATAELVRLGAADRRWLVVGAPTGRGWVNHVLLRALEAFTDGDVACVASQFGATRSISAARSIKPAVTSLAALLAAIDAEPRLRNLPRIIVGESFGAWTLTSLLPDVARRPPAAVALVGTPGVARLDRKRALLADLAAAGTRIVRIERTDDPVVAFPGVSLAWRPTARWREADRRPWRPLATMRAALVAIDHATRWDKPDDLDASRHDYRRHLPAAAADLLGGVTEETLQSVRDTLLVRECAESSWAPCYGPAPCTPWPGPDA